MTTQRNYVVPIIFVAVTLVLLAQGCSLGGSTVSPDTPAERKVSAAFVGPVAGGKTNDAIVMETRSLIAALASAGFSSAALKSNADPLPGTGPALVIAARTGDEYCLEGRIRVDRLPSGDPVSFELRQPLFEGAMKLSRNQCSKAFVDKLVSELSKRKL